MILIANIIDFLASMVQVGSGVLKSKSKILISQIVMLIMQTVSMFMLGGITGAISNIISCIRNYLCYKEKLNWPIKIILIIIQLVMTIKFNTQGALGWIPFIVCTVFVIFMDIKDEIKFKILVTVSFLPWCFYFFAIKSYTGGTFAAITTFTNLIALISMIKDKKQEE